MNEDVSPPESPVPCPEAGATMNSMLNAPLISSNHVFLMLNLLSAKRLQQPAPEPYVFTIVFTVETPKAM
jgi:hypothetical protein